MNSEINYGKYLIKNVFIFWKQDFQKHIKQFCLLKSNGEIILEDIKIMYSKRVLKHYRIFSTIIHIELCIT